MLNKHVLRISALAAVVAVGPTVLASETGPIEAGLPGETVAKSTVKLKQFANKRQPTLIKEIDEKSQVIGELSAKAKTVTANMTKLAANSKGDENESLMKAMLQELQEMNQRLTKLQEEVDELKGWKEGQDEALPVIAFELAEARKFKPSLYMQFQYRDSDERGSQDAFNGQHSYQFRRVRFGGSYQIDPFTSIKASFDGSANFGTSGGRSFELKDAILQWDLVKKDDMTSTSLYAGQLALPLGYELSRSSSEREMPERMTGSRRMFDGERFRGAYLTHGLNENAWVWGGVVTALTVNDPEQRTSNVTRFGRHAVAGGVRYDTENISAGVAYFGGERPSTTGQPNSPDVDRSFWFFDFTYVGLLTEKLVLRSEAWIGKDRIPSTAAVVSGMGQDMSAYHIQLLYNISERNQIFTRYAMFDPNTDTGANSVREFGIGYRYYINPGASLTFAYEWFDDAALRSNSKYEVATLRYQFKF